MKKATRPVRGANSHYSGLHFVLVLVRVFIPLIGGTEKSALWVNPPYARKDADDAGFRIRYPESRRFGPCLPDVHYQTGNL